MKILSWNVNGIRATHKKGEITPLFSQGYDVICFQETKAEREQLPIRLQEPEGYVAYFNSSQDRKGHSGVVTYVRTSSSLRRGRGGGADIQIETTINSPADTQGRLLATLFFEQKLAVINVYVPNGASKTSPLEIKLEYYEKLLAYMQQLENDGYEVVLCGDINVAHEPIDLARPKENQNRIGFLPEERAWIDEFIGAGFIDIYRERYPEKIEYSYWDLKTRARDRNVGWRIDYFFVSESLEPRVKKIKILTEQYGSDHCPVILELQNL